MRKTKEIFMKTMKALIQKFVGNVTGMSAAAGAIIGFFIGGVTTAICTLVMAFPNSYSHVITIICIAGFSAMVIAYLAGTPEHKSK